MTRLECIFAYRILPLLIRPWIEDRNTSKDPVVLWGGGGGVVTVGISGWSWGTATISLQQTTFNYCKKITLLQTNWTRNSITLINFVQTIAIPDQNPIILFCLATKLWSGERQREDHTEDVRERI